MIYHPFPISGEREISVKFMLGKFLPKQKTFFDLFKQAAQKLVLASEEFSLLVNDLPDAEKHAKKINDYEHEGDAIALLSYQLLHKSFITPFDRHDIHLLTTQLDDILDQINRLAQRFVVYHFNSIPLEIDQLAKVNLQVTEKVKAAVDKLDSLKNQQAIIEVCADIDQLENDAEAVLLTGLDNLFLQENDFKQLIKLKEVFEQIKAITNSCQDAANLVKSIMLEYA